MAFIKVCFIVTLTLLRFFLASDGLPVIVTHTKQMDRSSTSERAIAMRDERFIVLLPRDRHVETADFDPHENT